MLAGAFVCATCGGHGMLGDQPASVVLVKFGDAPGHTNTTFAHPGCSPSRIEHHPALMIDPTTPLTATMLG